MAGDPKNFRLVAAPAALDDGELVGVVVAEEDELALAVRGEVVGSNDRQVGLVGHRVLLGLMPTRGPGQGVTQGSGGPLQAARTGPPKGAGALWKRTGGSHSRGEDPGDGP